MKTVALYPGSFDPPHSGHVMVASFVAQYGVADEVWFMPSGINPLKVESVPKASDTDRLAMCRLAADGLAGVKVSDFELGLPRPSYTYRTLCALSEAFPDYKFRLIIGSDNWHAFPRWKDTDKIISEFGVIIYPRPGYDVDATSLPEGVTLLPESPMMLISSSFIREFITQGKSAAGFVPNPVADYIASRNLYKV